MSDDAPYVLALDGSRPLPRALVGGKAWSLNHMRALGIPVPPAIVLTTAAWRRWRDDGALPPNLRSELGRGIATIGAAVGRTFAGTPPLLLSVRSGAAESMPGMMDTILNLGLSAAAEVAIGAESGDAAFARDLARRFGEQFATLVGAAPPADPSAQLDAAIEAVLRSWDSPRASAYRAHRGLDDDAGTAVTIQAMVFGNRDDRSGTGVLFTRDPLTGEDRPYGEWLPRAQGEDVVSGRVTPQPLAALAAALPEAHAALLAAARTIEADAGDMQDIEFTVESGRLWLLQARAGKRSADAAVRIAVELAEAGQIDRAEALRRVSPAQLRTACAPRIDPAGPAELLASGEPACTGFASGIAVTDPDEALVRGEAGEPVILVRIATSPDDVHGMIAAAGVVTATGGATSHAAVVCRELDRPCIVGCGADVVDALAGREVTIDGAVGRIYAGRLAVVSPDPAADPWLARLLRWAQQAGGTDGLAEPAGSPDRGVGA